MEKKEQEVAGEYLSSLADLNLNSKPLINMLTILAEENIEYAPVIVKAVEQHISKVNPDVKLPVLYLIDSIVKNVGRDYITLFSHRIVNIFCGVFEKVNEKIREKMYTLRQTWNDVFTPQKLYALDVKVNCMDPNWPITAKVTAKIPVSKSPSIHVNPNFLKNQPKPLSDMEAKLRDKQRQLLELQKRKLELELAATKQRLEEQEKQFTAQTETVKSVAPIALPPSMMPPITSASVPPRQMFNIYRPPQTRLPGVVMSNNFMNCPPNMNKPRVAPVNPNLLNTLRHRDPRLARQQQLQSQQQHLVTNVADSEENSTANLLSKVETVNTPTSDTKKESIDTTKTEPSPNDVRKLNADKTNIDRLNARDNSSSKSSSYHGDKDRLRSNSSGRKHKDSNEKSDKSISSSSGRSKSTSRTNSSGSTKTSNNSGSKTNERDNRNKDRSSTGSSFFTSSRDDDRRKSGTKSGSPHFRSDKSSSKSPRERSPKRSTTDLTKHNTVGTSSPVKDVKQNTKSRNYMKRERERDRDKCSSPSITDKPQDIDLRSVPVSDKRIKLDDNSLYNKNSGKNLQQEPLTIGSIISLNRNIVDGTSSTSTTKSKDLEKNLEAVSNKDVDLRQFQTNKSLVGNLSSVDIDNNISSSSTGPIFDGSSTGNILLTDDNKPLDMDIDSKKRQFINTGSTVDEPATKKLKEDEKIDDLFGKEDVDLRNFPLLGGVTVSSVMPMTPPPPPIISNESENWAKVKGSKLNKTSPISSNFDDVRAKLAKAAKNHLQKLDKNKERKSRFSDINEDSSDGTDANIRTIISQAQELLASENINLEQYNTLVKTVIQINETNKLKEAQRRESLLSNNTNSTISSNLKTSKSIPPETQLKEVKEEDSDAQHTSMLKAKSKALQKRIPKLPKDASTIDINVEHNSILQRSSPPPQPNLNYADTRNNANLKSEKRGISTGPRQKDSKWSSPWDHNSGNSNHQNSNKQHWLSQSLGSVGGGAMGMSRISFNQKLSGLAHNAAINPQNRISMLNLWNNPPPMIFAGGNIPSVPAALQLTPLTVPASTADKVIPITKFCNSVDNPKDDIVRTINIDSVAKEIRVYGEIAIVFMDWDQPREIGFQNGQRRIIIDDQEPITLNFNDGYTTVNIANNQHRIRFGCPSRELYINDNWYECCFGGPPIAIPIDGKVSIFKIEGPPPQVNIGNLRQDLVVGKINLIIDARIIIPVFLDAKVQSFEVDGKKHTLQFADCLKTVLIDGESISVEYGGLPKSLYLGGVKYFIRFGTLPNGVVPGKCFIKDMIRTESFSVALTTMTTTTTTVTTPAIVNPIVQNTIRNELLPKVDGNVSNTPSSILPIVATKIESNESNKTGATINKTIVNAGDLTITKPPSQSLPPQTASLNIDELFQKLLASGILNQSTNNINSNQDSNAKKIKDDVIHPIDLSKSETIKTRQAGLVQKLFSGMQCSSCGVRFPPEQTMKYSQHLDWHFRQNRRERDSSRKAHSRKWYYDVSDWIQYEEIEDIEEREKNWFETQQSELDNPDDSSNQRMNSPCPSCPAGPDDVDRACDMCHDKFEQFYNEESEEWHLKSAIRVDDKIYHPLCYQDYKTSLTFDESSLQNVEGTEDNAVDTVLIKEEAEIENDKSEVVVEDDEDDDVIVLPTEEPSITEIPSDDDDVENVDPEKSSLAPINNKETLDNSKSENQQGSADQDVNENEANQNDSIESDVEIQEPNIPFTDLDTYEEPTASLSTVDESSQPSQFKTIKIKEEPKDSDNEYDAFEDVGTFLSVDEISQSVDEYVPLPVSTLHGNENLVASIDGNVEIQDTQSTNVGVNKIKINITKNTTTSLPSLPGSSTTTTPTLTQKFHNIPVIESGSAIPVICNFNKEISSNNFIVTINTRGDNNKYSSINDNHKKNSSTSLTTNIKTLTSSSYDIGIDDNNKSCSGDNSKKICNSNTATDDGSSIQYELKSQMKNVIFKKSQKVCSGYETSGLCSIM